MERRFGDALPPFVRLTPEFLYHLLVASSKRDGTRGFVSGVRPHNYLAWNDMNGATKAAWRTCPHAVPNAVSGTGGQLAGHRQRGPNNADGGTPLMTQGEKQGFDREFPRALGADLVLHRLIAERI